MKYWIFILCVFVACKKDEVAIPTYFQINEIGFNDNINGETSTSKISDAWFYVNDQKQGIYEMPCRFPVIGHGTNNIKIFSGIKVNGISASRDIYPFYESYDTTINFISDSILSLLPTTKYKQNLNFYSEDFDGLGNNFDISINSDTNFISPFPTDSVYGQLSNVGKVILQNPFLNFEATTFEIDDFPSAGSPVYLELDYKNNSTFIIGAYVNFSQSRFLNLASYCEEILLERIFLFLLLIVCLTSIFLPLICYLLIPSTNKATDNGNSKKFKILHTVSVLLTFIVFLINLYWII